MKMVLRAFTAATALGLGVGTAVAADISTGNYGYDWSGLYLGAHGGYLWGDTSVTYGEDPGGGDLDGFWGGALAGFNYQHEALVLGVEGDFGIGDVNGKGIPVCQFPNPCGGKEVYDYSYDLDWNAHLRARAGFAVDRALFFVGGGLAVAGHTLGIEETTTAASGLGFALPPPGPTTKSLGDDSKTHYGWTIGGGVEYAVTDNVLLRAEYLYDDYGSKTYRDNEGQEYDVDLTAQTVRAAVSFKF